MISPSGTCKDSELRTTSEEGDTVLGHLHCGNLLLQQQEADLSEEVFFGNRSILYSLFTAVFMVLDS